MAFPKGPRGTNNFLLQLLVAAFYDENGNSRPASLAVTSSTFGTTTTDASAAVYTAMANVPANRVEVINRTGKSLKFRHVGSGAVYTLPDGATKTFSLIANVNELEVASATAGAVSFDWEAVK
jgi:hypothetical protein